MTYQGYTCTISQHNPRSESVSHHSHGCREFNSIFTNVKAFDSIVTDVKAFYSTLPDVEAEVASRSRATK